MTIREPEPWGERVLVFEARSRRHVLSVLVGWLAGDPFRSIFATVVRIQRDGLVAITLTGKISHVDRIYDALSKRLKDTAL